MKKLIEKILDKFAKISVPWCIFAGIANTVILVKELCELYKWIKIYNIHLDQPGIALIPSIVGMVLFYGMAILIPIVRKRQYYKHVKKEENSDEEDN